MDSKSMDNKKMTVLIASSLGFTIGLAILILGLTRTHPGQGSAPIMLGSGLTLLCALLAVFSIKNMKMSNSKK